MTKQELTIETIREHLFSLEFMLSEKEEEIHDDAYFIDERELITNLITLVNSLD